MMSRTNDSSRLPERRQAVHIIVLLSLGASLLLPAPFGSAYDASDQLSLGGLVAVVGQCQELIEGAGKRDACRVPLVIRPHVSFRPTKQDELYAELAFASGNGLNKVSPFELAPWGADLKDDLEDINGRGRNYLVNAWYRHEFDLAPDNRTSTTLGIIDSTDFLDNNAFANDEYTQFLNQALVNSPQVLLPSYDLGTALQWDVGNWSIRTVYMNVGKDREEEDGEKTKLTDRDLGKAYDYLAAEIGYSVRTPIGDGHYRVSVSGTSRDFVDPNAMRAERQYIKDEKTSGRSPTGFIFGLRANLQF